MHVNLFTTSQGCTLFCRPRQVRETRDSREEKNYLHQGKLQYAAFFHHATRYIFGQTLAKNTEAQAKDCLV